MNIFGSGAYICTEGRRRKEGDQGIREIGYQEIAAALRASQ
jgi:hypothetical protein